MGCVAIGSVCAPEADLPSRCCADQGLVCAPRDGMPDKYCKKAEIQVENKVSSFRSLSGARMSGFYPEEGVGACMNQDVALIGLANQNGHRGVTGCADAVEYCTNPKVATLCPATCTAQSGCGAKENMQAQAIGSIANPGEIAVMALAVVGSITIISKVFTSCTRKVGYNVVLEEKNSEEI